MDERRIAPAAERNKNPILTVLRRVLPESGLMLEIASGTGQHVVHFARALPRLTWQPSDPAPDTRASIAAWTGHAGLSNICPPLEIDVLEEVWGIKQADAVICINMIHIAPWAATRHLMVGASRLLPARGVLFLYGPFQLSGRHTAPSNARFDTQLRGTNPEWGVRDLEVVKGVAEQNGFILEEVVEMPSNNLSIVFRRG